MYIHAYNSHSTSNVAIERHYLPKGHDAECDIGVSTHCRCFGCSNRLILYGCALHALCLLCLIISVPLLFLLFVCICVTDYYFFIPFFMPHLTFQCCRRVLDITFAHLPCLTSLRSHCCWSVVYFLVVVLSYICLRLHHSLLAPFL